ncbi:conjugative transposon protein TraM [Chitinophaga silvisoli]|uniref:Conjugative transposon protein TraM n=1 Tax=Chitinophaga silvisoli TaxID=2291814 RepID=A0A3E1P2T3_9BACT|nr:conjugative transposon protein TraM [Chitinophaga silvisoli]RFM34424.1 conjugative transposon protein TraM [Chitinophaga silvisoli]
MEKEKLKVRILLFMPVVVIPLLCLIFYAMGGAESGENPVMVNPGFNKILPSPIVEEKEGMDKLSLYRKAENDSLSFRSLAQRDPYAITPLTDSGNLYQPTVPSMNFKKGNADNPTEGEDKIKEQLAFLQKQLSTPDKAIPDNKNFAPRDTISTQSDEQIKRLEQMMQAMQAGTNTPDPEMAQLDNMLDKVLDIQNPSRIKNKLKEESLKNKGKVYPVTISPSYQGDDLLPVKINGADSMYNKWKDSVINPYFQPSKRNQFFDLNGMEEQQAQTNAVSAVIDEKQTLVTESTLKIRLTQDIFIKGQLIPKGTHAFAVCDLRNERLAGEIKEIQYKGNIYPVSLIIYDGDGIAGIRVPGAISRDVAKDEAANAIQTLQMASLDPNIGAQAASAGISAAKSLLSKKTKLINVTVKSGHPILLLDGNQE